MDLRQHRQDQLHEEEEIRGSEPGYAPIAHLLCHLLRHAVQFLFGLLLLHMEASIACCLLLQVFYIRGLKTRVLRLLRYYFEEAKRRGQVL